MSDKLHGGVVAGASDVSLPVLLRKTADNIEKTGVAHTDVTARYWRQGGTPQSVTMSALTDIDDSHADGGWKEVDATSQSGLYRMDWPDAAFAAGADWVMLSIKVATCFVFHERFALDSMTAATNADAVLAELVADHKATSGSLADVINQIRAATAAAKIVNDKAAGETTFKDTDGTTTLFTLKVQAGQTDNEVELVRT